MAPNITKFDIYRLTYDSASKRILSKLAIGGYDEWFDAALAELQLTNHTDITNPKAFTIRLCTHTDNLYVKEKHVPIYDLEELKARAF